MMMMMSQPIQPNRTSSPQFGTQGFIQGRQRLQQQRPNTLPAQPASAFQLNDTRENQALFSGGNNTEDPRQRSFNPADLLEDASSASPVEYGAPQAQRTQQTARFTASTLPYQEIQTIAEKAGYVGVSQRDIDRAYRLNKSLLVDYRA